MKNAVLLANAMLLLSSYAGHAQDADSAAKGLRRKVCHYGARQRGMSPLPQAPPSSRWPTPGMTGLALTVWMQSSHPTMPTSLKPDELRNVVAIRSLDRKGWRVMPLRTIVAALLLLILPRRACGVG
jgi:hypothetical protein